MHHSKFKKSEVGWILPEHLKEFESFVRFGLRRVEFGIWHRESKKIVRLKKEKQIVQEKFESKQVCFLLLAGFKLIYQWKDLK